MTMTPPIPAHMRGPARITTTLPRHLYDALNARAKEEGRSLSNLVAFLLENAIGPYQSS